MVAFERVYVPSVTVVPVFENRSNFKLPSALKVYLLQAEFSQAKVTVTFWLGSLQFCTVTAFNVQVPKRGLIFSSFWQEIKEIMAKTARLVAFDRELILTGDIGDKVLVIAMNSLYGR